MRLPSSPGSTVSLDYQGHCFCTASTIASCTCSWGRWLGSDRGVDVIEGRDPPPPTEIGKLHGEGSYHPLNKTPNICVTKESYINKEYVAV